MVSANILKILQKINFGTDDGWTINFAHVDNNC